MPRDSVDLERPGHSCNKQLLALTLASALAVSTAQAAPHLDELFQVHSYGTLGVVHSTENDADFVVDNLTQPQGVGYSGSWRPDVDSKVALQIDGHFTDKLSGVVQLIAENENNNSWTGHPNPRFRPSLEWANLKYQVTDNWSVRAGRMILPVNLMSEYRNVGYSLPFIRPPVEVYGVLPYKNTDGVQTSYRSEIGGAINTVMAGAGATSVRVGSSSEYHSFQAREYVFNDTLEIGSLTVRAAYLFDPFKTPVGVGNLFQQFVTAAEQVPGGTAAANTVAAIDHRLNSVHWGNIQLVDLAATYDPGDWLVMLEANRFWNSGIAGNADSGFVTAGYRYHAFTPYVTFSRAFIYNAPLPVIPLAGLPAELAAYGGFLNDIVQSFAANKLSQRTISTGLRWDFARNLDFKVQYDYIRLDRGSYGLLVLQQPGFRLGSNLSLLSVAVDFAF